MRKTFESEIQQLKDELLLMGSMVEQQILESVEALKKRDTEASHRIFNADSKINSKRFGIEEQVMILIATQQPMAHDLRVLASTLEIISELERMGDYAKGIANINIRMGDEELLKPLIDIPRMAEKGVDMLHRSLTAFVNEDIETARTIPVEDDIVDALYNQGVIAWNAGKAEDAKKAFEEALKLDPKHANSHYQLGMCFVNLGKMPEAVTEFESYLQVAPDGQYAAQAKALVAQLKK